MQISGYQISEILYWLLSKFLTQLLLPNVTWLVPNYLARIKLLIDLVQIQLFVLIGAWAKFRLVADSSAGLVFRCSTKNKRGKKEKKRKEQQRQRQQTPPAIHTEKTCLTYYMHGQAKKEKKVTTTRLTQPMTMSCILRLWGCHVI